MLLAPLWTFSTRAAADGALLLSAWLEVILLRYHCLLKDWRYSQAALQVCYFLSGLIVMRVACVFMMGGEEGGGMRWVEGGGL